MRDLQADMALQDVQLPDTQAFRFDFTSGSDRDAMLDDNQSNRADIMKKYMVYMELPKIKLGDYRKSSCVTGNVIRFHFLLRIARDEDGTVLQLLPIKAYKAPVVNFAVIHRPFLEDEEARGPIPKSPNTRSPLIRYSNDDAPVDTQTDDIADNFSSTKPADQRADDEQISDLPQESQQPAESQVSRRDSEPRQLEVESPSRHEEFEEPDSGAATETEPQPLTRFISEDNSTAQTNTTAPLGSQKQRRPKKYFVYCEIPKVLIGDYRNSSVICSEIIHAHFLLKIATDEQNGQPKLQPIRRYHRPKVNFAVIHRSLIVDDEAIGPIPRSPNVRSPMIKEDDEDEELEKKVVNKDEMMRATMGFCYGRLPRSKYELISQWSMVPNERGDLYPELVLSKAEA